MASKGICPVDGCGKASCARGFCQKHYTRWQRHGDPTVRKVGGLAPRGRCSHPGCNEPHKAKGLCGTHYARLVRTGRADCADTPDGAPAAWIEAHRDFAGDECLRWPFAHDGHGYGVVRVLGRNVRVSRIMCEAAHGPPPSPKHQAAHNCGKGHEGCVNPRHLRWDTHSGNQADRLIHGTHNRGERHPLSRLTEEDVRAIRRLAGAESASAVGKRFSIHPTHVRDIQRRKAWAWLM